MHDSSEEEPFGNSRVGYRHPPTSTRFRKGQSGNPRGRPKGTINLSTLLERILREKVVIHEDGKLRRVTKLEAVIRQLNNKAVAGESKALQLLTSLVRSAEERAVHAPAQKAALNEADEKVFLGILARLHAANTGEKIDDTDAR